MTLEQALRLTNRNMIAFDLILGSGGDRSPPRRRSGCSATTSPPPTPRASSSAAARSGSPSPPPTPSPPLRDEPRDWWALAWLRGTEIATDALWAESPAVSRPGAKAGLRLAGVANLAMAAGFAWLSKRK